MKTPSPWLKQAALDQRRPTPYTAFDTGEAVAAYDRLVAAFRERTRVQYAVKARPDRTLLTALTERGSSLDVASPAEVEQALDAGCPPQDIACSNVFADARELAFAREQGVTVFTADSVAMTERLAAVCPGASVFVRFAHGHTAGAAQPLAGRFGCPESEAARLALHAVGGGLHLAGLSWHVGSQQYDPTQWERATARAARITRRLRPHGITVEHLNLGGGLPGTYRTDAPPVETYAEAILAAVDRHFPRPHQPRLVLEPGRAVVADAGVTVTSVKAVVDRACGTYVVLDAGLWNAGLLDNLGGIEYRVTFPGHCEDAVTRPVTLCGPTCDPLDTFTAGRAYRAPVALVPGDRAVIWSTGAYCSTSTLVGFNGYPPVPQHVRAAVSEDARPCF
ncbi:hypothetical protein [Streptomyces ziwulingensis]|uniref:Type III PLP-dependent enzyme n=1 Tax=Streptomyces ziwulingensis TaxID=1045501 RepID=A0ABP9C314_9ACTN